MTVAFVLIPQSIAYAGVAGMPPEAGLYAACLPLLAAAVFASSPYLQTGPAAMSSLLTFGALTGMAVAGSDRYIELAMLLAVLVGVFRLLIGALRAGLIAHLLSEPMLMGFVPAAAVLIIFTQLPIALGTRTAEGGPLAAAAQTLGDPGAWAPLAAVLTAVTISAMVIARRRWPLFPAVPAAIAGGLAATALLPGLATVGPISAELPSLDLALPAGEVPALALPAAIIGLVGFAETAAAARSYAIREHMRWSADREFIGQGVANVVSGITGGFPVGGSLSRTSLNHAAGALTRVSGAITGLAVLAFLPFTPVLENVPAAIPAAVVIAGVVPLVRLRPLLRLWRVSRPQSAVAAATFVLTLISMPHLERAVLAGVALSLLVHLTRELALRIEVSVKDETLDVRPTGVLWFATASRFGERIETEVDRHPGVSTVHLDLEGVGRVDVTATMALDRAIEDLRSAGLEVEIDNVPAHARRLLGGNGSVRERWE